MDNIDNNLNSEIHLLNKNIDRLNYLYFQSKKIGGLNQEELEEQGLLRERFLKLVKKNIRY